MQSAYRRKFWRNMMRAALSYEEWGHAANVSYSISFHVNVIFTLFKKMSIIDTVISKLTHDFFPTIISIPR
jgi:hypothetical protein